MKIVWFALLSTLTFASTKTLSHDAQEAAQRFRTRDSSIKKFFDQSVGYVIFPNVGKGAWIIGGAHGNGIVYKAGSKIGRAELTQLTIGYQVGGQEFSEIIFFKTEKALEAFKHDQLQISATASAVVAADGAAAKAKYDLDVAVFVLPKSGLMLEASVGGQKFGFEPND